MLLEGTQASDRHDLHGDKLTRNGAHCTHRHPSLRQVSSTPTLAGRSTSSFSLTQAP